MAGLLTLAGVLSTAAPAPAATPSSAHAAMSAGVAASAAVPPDPGSPLPRRIASLAIKQIGAAERGGEDHYPTRYTKVNKNIVWAVDWCGVFVYWAWAKAGVRELPRMKAPPGAKPWAQGHWATYWKKWARTHDRWKPISKRNPWIGDAIVYGNYPDSGHIGVVVNVKYDRNAKVSHVRTVEGNVANKVTDLGWRKITELTGGGQKATGFVSPI